MTSNDENLIGKLFGKFNKPIWDKKSKNAEESVSEVASTPESESISTTTVSSATDEANKTVKVAADGKEPIMESRTQLLLEFTNMINSYLNYEDLFQEVVRLIIELTGARRGLIMTYDSKADKLKFEIARDREGQSIDEANFRFSTSIVERVLESREPLVITDMDKNSELSGAHSVRMLQIQSVMCVPLRVRRQEESEPDVIGLVYVDNNSVAKIFDQKDIEFLMALANQAGIAIENARVYRELEKAHQDLLELDQMKNDFVTITTHELNTPLTAIVGYLDLIEMVDLSMTPKVLQEGIEIIKDSVNKLAEKIGEIIQISQIESNHLELKLQPVPLKDFMRDVCRRLAPFAKRRKQQLILQLPKMLPIVRLDQDKITVVITNLVMNAIRFTPDEGQIVVRAMVSPKSSEEVLISITDTGIGIDEKYFERIFEPFVELTDVMSHRSGTIEFLSAGQGLGLTIARGLVEFHRGEIWIESKIKKGSTFYFTLPINPPTGLLKTKAMIV